MLTRILTSAVGLVVFFTLLFIPNGEWFFAGVVSLIIAVMLWEVYRSVKSHKLLCCIGYLSMIVILGFIMFFSKYLQYALPLCIVMYFIAMVVLHKKVDYREVLTNCLLTFYITYFMGSLITIRHEFDVFAVLLVFICAWTTDTGAYFVGCFFGKHKLIPKVSPKKTVEGAVGGVIVCLLCNIVYIHILGLIDVSNIVFTCVFSVVISILSQFGDLAASAIKRDCEVKDFGNLLPGHGGLTDRFDSVTFIVPMILMLLKFI